MTDADFLSGIMGRGDDLGLVAAIDYIAHA
jgi:hypothetical protein